MAAHDFRWKFCPDNSHLWDDGLKKGHSSCPEAMPIATSEILRNDVHWNPSLIEPEATGLKQCTYRGIKEAFLQNSRASRVTSLRGAGKSTSDDPPMVFGSAHISCHEAGVGGALHTVDSMDQQGMQPSLGTFFRLLQKCIDKNDLVAARKAHCLLVRNGVDSDAFLVSHLIRMFASLKCLSEAKQVFKKIYNPTVFSWSAIISAHVKLGETHQAIELYDLMEETSVKPDGHIFVAVLKACAAMTALTKGKLIHAHIINSGLGSNVFVGNCLVYMYAECGSFQDADKAFHSLPRQNVLAWNALIAAYANSGHGKEALHLFQQMQWEDEDPDQATCNVIIVGYTQHSHGQEDMKPNAATFIFALKACSKMSALEHGKWVHSRIIERELESDLSVANTLIDTYGKCGSLKDACLLFERLPRRDVVTWSVLIAIYTQYGHCWEALELFCQMQDEGIEPDQCTFVCTLKACSSIAALEQGKQIHNHIIESQCESDLYVGSTLIDMYSKCGSFQDAWIIFDGMTKRSVVTWNAMISGYVQHSLAQEALGLFHQMNQDGIEPDPATFISVLQACSSLAALEQGKKMHVHIVESGFESDVFVSTTLIDMYSKCGSLKDARIVFDRWSKQDVATWNALIAGLAQHNDYLLAVDYFEDMQRAGLKPNEVTFICLLSACSHTGLVDKGRLHFKSMQESYGIAPTCEHYDSMVDLFGHAGCLKEAEDLLETLPFVPSVTKWTSLLSSCRRHGNVDLARRCFDQVVNMDRGNASGYVLMSNIYARAGLHEDAKTVEELRTYANGWKKPARAFIEIENQVHDFTVGNKTHPQSDDIYAKLKSLSIQMSEEGYMPQLDLVLDSITNDDKETALCGHCEKLAIAFGLISTPRGATLRVAKNLRVCADCHTATKIISKIEMREIIIADTYRSHHFKDGFCSCKDVY